MIRYSRGVSKFDANPEVREAPDFATFAKAVLRDRAHVKGKQYVTAPFRANGDGRPHRGKDFCEPRRFLALDVDFVADADTGIELRMWLARFHGFGFTTASSAPERPRYRVLLELDRDADRAECMSVGAAVQRDLAEEFGDRVKLDPSTHRGEQPCYLPVIESEAFHLDGDPLRVDTWLATAPTLEPERKGSAAIAPGDDPVIVALKERAMYRRDLGGGRHAIVCPWASEHSSEDAADSTATCYFQPHHGGFVSPGFRCLHEHCSGRKGDDLIERLGVDWRAVKDAYGAGTRAPHAVPDVPAYVDDVPPLPGVIESALTAPASGWPVPLDLAVLAKIEPALPKFIITQWLPSGYASLLAAHGGSGKSTIALLQAVCVALGLPFAGIDTQRRRVLYLSCEDRASVVHWRLSRICRHLGIDMASLSGWLYILDLVGYDSMLWVVDPRAGGGYTAAYGHLEACIKATLAQVVYVDGIADVYGGDEINRAQVKRFVNALVALVGDDGALVLIGHVNKLTAASAQSNEGYSGSTGWHNAVRARWYLYPETAQDEDGGRPTKTGRLALELQKSNLGPTNDSIAWRWSETAHMFLPEQAQTNFDRVSQQRDERRGILLAMRACAEADIDVPGATTGRRTAFHVLSAQPAFADSMRSGKPASRRFWREIEHLRAIKLIEDSSIRRADYHKVATLALTTEGIRACGQ